MEFTAMPRLRLCTCASQFTICVCARTWPEKTNARSTSPRHETKRPRVGYDWFPRLAFRRAIHTLETNNASVSQKVFEAQVRALGRCTLNTPTNNSLSMTIVRGLELVEPTTPVSKCKRSEERRVGKECRSRW